MNVRTKYSWENLCKDLSRVRRVTGYLTDDEQGGLRAWKGCVDQIFILKQISEKAQEKKHNLCGFY